MNITGIAARNVRTHAETIVSISDGITGIVGDNESGKSTLTEVLAWTFYGAQAIRKTMKGFRWDRAPKTRQAESVVDMGMHGKAYRVARSEKDATVREGDVLVAEGPAAVSAYMEKLLGRSLEEFMVAPICQQDDVKMIAKLKPAPRQAFIRRLLGVGRLDDALDALRKRLNEIKRDVMAMGAGLGERGPLVQRLEAEKESYLTAKREIEAWVAAEHEVSAALSRADTEAVLSTSRKAVYDRLQGEKESAGTQQTVAASGRLRTSLKLDDARKAAVRVAEADVELSRLPALGEEFERLREARYVAAERSAIMARLQSRGEVTALNARVDVLNLTMLEYDSEVHVARRHVSEEVERRLGGLRGARLERLAAATADANSREAQGRAVLEKVERLAKLGDAGACPTCTRPLEGTFAAVIQALREEGTLHLAAAQDIRADAGGLQEPDDVEVAAAIAANDARELLAAYMDVKRASEAAATDILSVRARRDSLAEQLTLDEKALAALPDVKYDDARFRVVEHECRELTGLNDGLAMARGMAAGVPALEAELAEFVEAERWATERRALLDVEIAEVRFDAAGHASILATASKAAATHTEARLATARGEQVIKACGNALGAAKEALAEYDRRAETVAARKKELHTYTLAEALLDDFRSRIIDQIRPDMEELVTGFVHVLTDGRHEAVTLTEDFQCVLHEGGIEREVVSGGTENITALAMRLAIAQMIAERSGDPEGLLILDEPFDGIDETRRQNVITLIRNLAGIYRQVIVISHLPDTRHAVDHVIEIRFDDASGRTIVVKEA